ncbi:MAG: DUF2237 domain-containing protein [Pseudomonadota bacterium]|nr:DUF2237 domain-containing protein [Pseudomonadota bacterium]
MRYTSQKQKNIFGETLEVCSNEPLTGFFRDGSCNTCAEDVGSHTICVEVTKEFLEFSAARGNDLSTPRPELNFAGLKPGDRWCLCASRWAEAEQEGKAPLVVGAATNREALTIVPEYNIRKYLIVLN